MTYASSTSALSYFPESTWLLRMAFAAVVTITLGRYLHRMVALRRRYDGIESLPTTWFLGNLLGHMENFVTLNSPLDITIGEWVARVAAGLLMSFAPAADSAGRGGDRHRQGGPRDGEGHDLLSRGTVPAHCRRDDCQNGRGESSD